MSHGRSLAPVLLVLLAVAGCRSRAKSDGERPATTPAASTCDASPRDDMITECPAALLEARRDGTLPNRYVVPTEDERAKMKALVTKLLARGDAGLAEARAEAGKFGFEIVDASEVAGVVVVREIATRRRGGGAYLVRLGSASHLVVQAPHTFFDVGTLPLACEMFRREDARALFVNTMHRYKGAPADANGDHPSDVAHAPSSLFQSATEGALEAVPGASVVQLHGFATREPPARAVVSSGERRAGHPLVARAAAALTGVVGGPVLKYPDDTSELGATTNAQGMIVRAAGGRFLHVEMDEGLRRDLACDPALRGRAFDALARALEAK
jgi:hypothetical protein